MSGIIPIIFYYLSIKFVNKKLTIQILAITELFSSFIWKMSAGYAVRKICLNFSMQFYSHEIKNNFF